MVVGTTVVAFPVVVTGGLTVVALVVVGTEGLTVVALVVVGTGGLTDVALGIVAGEAGGVPLVILGEVEVPSEGSAPKTQCASAHSSSSAAVVMASFMLGARKPTLTAV